MEKELMISENDFTFFSQQTPQNLSLILSSMVSLMHANENILTVLDKQPWFLNMCNAISGKNRMSLEEIHRNQDAVDGYLSSLMIELMNRNCIDDQMISSLSIKINDLYGDHIVLQKLLGTISAKLNEKIESVNAQQHLLRDITEGEYSGQKHILALLKIIAKLDFRIMNDTNELLELDKALRRGNVLENLEYTFEEYLLEIADAANDDIEVVYSEMMNVHTDVYEEPALRVIEMYNLLPDHMKRFKDKTKVVKEVIDSCSLNGDAKFSLEEFYVQIITSKADQIKMLQQTTERLAAEKHEELEFDEEEKTIEEADPEHTADLEHLELSKGLYIKKGEVRRFENNNIHIAGYVNCEGELFFENCVIHYNEHPGDEFSIQTEGKLHVVNSVIICHGYDEKTFILSKENAEIVFERTTFVDCSNFFHNESVCNFRLNECKLHNCFDEFIVFDVYEEGACIISNNLILQDGVKLFNLEQEYEWCIATLIKINANEKPSLVKIANNQINQKDALKELLREDSSDYRYVYFDCNDISIDQCTFVGLSTPLQCCRVSDCKFENCSGAITLSCYHEKPEVNNCLFVNCTDIIETCEGAKIANCHFIACYNRLIYSLCNEGGVLVEYCQFHNIINNRIPKIGYEEIHDTKEGFDSCITFARERTRKAKPNNLKKCGFKNIDLKQNYLIKASGSGELPPYDAVAFIKDCNFEQCFTERASAKVIKEFNEVRTLLGKTKSFHANVVSDCKGLDTVNVGCKNNLPYSGWFKEQDDIYGAMLPKDDVGASEEIMSSID